MSIVKAALQKALNKDRSYPDRPIPQPPMEAKSCPPVSLQDIYRYRFQHGVNLGGIFVLEKWLFGNMFEKSAEGASELDAVKASLARRGLASTIEKWQTHWSNALLDADLDFLVNEAHCNTVRLPVGYFTLGPAFCSDTPFEGEPGQVYETAWSFVLGICSKLSKAGIGVLIDMHALPGGANKDSHSGTSSPTAGLWNNKVNLALAKQCILFVAREIAAGQIPNCTGLQLCNEAAWAAVGMYDFYADVLQEVSQIDSQIPLYISDAWKLDTALTWARQHNTLASDTNLIIVDTHKYYTFEEKHKSKAPQELIRIVPEALAVCTQLAGNVHGNGAAPVFIGEYSCVMDGRSWARVSEGEKDDLTRQFGRAQCRRWREQSCGSAFWTLKMNWMPGGGWGFVAQTRKGNVQAPGYLALSWEEVSRRAGEANAQRDHIRVQEVKAHGSYWNASGQGQRFEHQGFEAGWNDGWADALVFFQARSSFNLGFMGGDRIGCLEGWIRKRMKEMGQGGPFGWEYEHGFRNAVSKAELLLLGGFGPE